jgi:hypothetical protein
MGVFSIWQIAWGLNCKIDSPFYFPSGPVQNLAQIPKFPNREHGSLPFLAAAVGRIERERELRVGNNDDKE